jgi:hypothetical protein
MAEASDAALRDDEFAVQEFCRDLVSWAGRLTREWKSGMSS